MHVLIVCLIVAAYLGGAFGLARLNGIFYGDKPRPEGLKLLDLFFLPANLLGLLLLCCVLSPFWWLYPERHASIIDFEGTDEEKRAWSEYKAILSHKPLWRRLAERLKLVPSSGPSWSALHQDATQ